MGTWEPDEDELDSLKAERQYIIFVPNPDDETNFSVLIVDTFSPHDKEETFNASNIVIKGILHMLHNELEYLVEKGDNLILKEHEESLHKSDNVLMFDPRKTKH